MEHLSEKKLEITFLSEESVKGKNFVLDVFFLSIPLAQVTCCNDLTQNSKQFNKQ